jgi:DNA-binding MarR family transcriptional regulator
VYLKATQQSLNMNSEEAIDQLTKDFMLIYYYVRLNLKTNDTSAIREVGKFKYRDKVELKIYHLSALWLIETLIEREKECVGKELRDLLIWKHPVCTKKTFGAKILDPLEAAGYIERNKISKRDRRTPVIEITEFGKHFLGRMKRSRRKGVESLLALVQVDGGSYENVANTLRATAERAWSIIQQEVNSKSDPSSDCNS